MQPVLIVIAGPNGAGKTTVTTRLKQDHWSTATSGLPPHAKFEDLRPAR